MQVLKVMISYNTRNTFKSIIMNTWFGKIGTIILQKI